jgi:hypothetical protein
MKKGKRCLAAHFAMAIARVFCRRLPAKMKKPYHFLTLVGNLNHPMSQPY